MLLKDSLEFHLIGKAGSGKTSIRTVMLPSQQGLGYFPHNQINQNQNQPKKIQLEIFDVGGSDMFYANFLKTQFAKMKNVIYVIHVEDKNWKEQIEKIANVLKPEKLYVLIHQLDRIEEGEQQVVYEKMKKEVSIHLLNNGLKPIEIFGTSIWQNSLFDAFCKIVQQCIPEQNKIQKILSEAAEVAELDEALLMEKESLLPIGYYSTNINKLEESEKQEQLHHIFQSYKIGQKENKEKHTSCLKIKDNEKAIFLNQFTEDTFILLVCKGQNIEPSALELVSKQTKKMFSKAFKL